MIARFLNEADVLKNGEEGLKISLNKVFGIPVSSVLSDNYRPSDWFIKETDTEKIFGCSAYLDGGDYSQVIICTLYFSKLPDKRRISSHRNIGRYFHGENRYAKKKALAFCRNVLKKANSMNDWEHIKDYIHTEADKMKTKSWGE